MPRRLAIAVLTLMVALTWFGVYEYGKQMEERQTAFEMEIQCGLILEHGEEFEGELSACQRQVAYLRALERK